MDTAMTRAIRRADAAVGQPSMRELVSMESFKLRKRLMTKMVFGIITAGMLLFMSIGYVGTRSADYATTAERQDEINGFLLPQVVANLSEVIGGIGIILLVMLAASMIGSEYGWGTVRVLASSGVSRTRLLAAKLIALAEAVALFVVAGMLTGIIGSLAITVVGGHELPSDWLSSATLGDAFLIVVRTTFLLLIPAILAFTIAIVSRSLAVGIAVGIGYQIAEQILSALLGSIGGVGERIQDLLISTNISAISQYNEIGGREINSDLPGPWQAVGVLTLYAVLLLAVSFTVFQRRDITSGSS